MGPVAGTLLVSIALGQFGFQISAGAQAVGFAVFIFSIGYQAGPRFLEILRAQGTRYFALALFVAAIGFLITWIAAKTLTLPPGASAGLLSGGFTSTPMLAAAQAAVQSGHFLLPAGWTAERVIASIGTSYAITYIVGTIGVIAIVSALPKILGLDLVAEARRLEKIDSIEATEHLQERAYRVENDEFCGPTIAELGERLWDKLSAVRIRRNRSWLKPAAGDHLRKGDELYAYGYANFFRGGIDRAGPEIRFPDEADLAGSWKRVVVIRSGAVGQTIRGLDLARQCGLVVSKVTRGGHALPVAPDLQLERSDILTVSGPVWGMDALAQMVGPVEPDLVETDMTIFAFGIALGAAIGLVSMNIGGIPLSLGMAGGLLLVGVAAGWLNSVRPSLAQFPEAARSTLADFGLVIFIAGVGLSSGGQIVETFRQAGPALIIASVFVVALPLLLGYAFGRKVLGLEPILLLGALTGAMTSGPALNLLARQAKSTVPALGYTGTYALACIISTIAGTLILYV